MSRWYRVFGSNHVQPEPAALLAHLRELAIEATGHFQGDQEGWFAAALALKGGPAVALQRYGAQEDGIRAELNAWAAWVETKENNPNHASLMQQLIATTQVFTMEIADGPNQAVADKACIALCRLLAHETAGVYQVDGLGFFDASGTELVPE
jgi:hypothetical protein